MAIRQTSSFLHPQRKHFYSRPLYYSSCYPCNTTNFLHSQHVTVAPCNTMDHNTTDFLLRYSNDATDLFYPQHEWSLSPEHDYFNDTRQSLSFAIQRTSYIPVAIPAIQRTSYVRNMWQSLPALTSCIDVGGVAILIPTSTTCGSRSLLPVDFATSSVTELCSGKLAMLLCFCCCCVLLFVVVLLLCVFFLFFVVHFGNNL